MTLLPIHPVTMPSSLAGQQNGKLDPSLLTPLHARGSLHHNAARGWKALVDAAAKRGMPLTFTYGGMYRPYADQEWLFRSRYSPDGQYGGCKTWNGVRWCKKLVNGRVPATAAVPGTSNHGWGLAIDTAFDSDLTDGIGPDDATYIASHPAWPWFRDNVINYGFSFEMQSEPWHIRWVVGDKIPQAVLEFEGTITPPLPPPSVGYDVIAVTDKFEFATAPRWDTRGFGEPLPVGEYVCKLDGSEGKVGAKVNLAVTKTGGGGFATAWKSGARPVSSSINYAANQTIANQIDVPVASDGTFKIYISTPAHIIVDLVGYWL